MSWFTIRPHKVREEYREVKNDSFIQDMDDSDIKKSNKKYGKKEKLG